MEAIYKNTRQQDFCALMVRYKALGFKPADAARATKKTSGAISQYLSGYGNPSDTVLSLFRKAVEEEELKKNGPPKEAPITDGRVHDQLNELREWSPSDYEAAKTVIGTLHQKLPMVMNSKKDPLTKEDRKKLAEFKKLKHQGKIPHQPH